MEPVALRGLQGPMFDPMGAAQKGMQLGQMGLEAQRLREALLTQQLEQERMRQTIQTEAIAQQKSRLEYQQAARKEDARKGLARLRTQFITKDSTGKEYLDHQGLYTEAVKQGYEPDVLEDLQQKALSTEAAKVKTASEKTAAFNTFFTNLARANANQTDPNKVAQNFQNGITQFANTFGVPKEEVEAYARTKMNWQPDETGRPPDVLANIRGYLQGIDISEKEQREAEAKGEGRSAADPNSLQSRQAREFLISRGLNPPANASLFDLRNMAQFKPHVKEYEEQLLSQVPSAVTRHADVQKAMEISASRMTYNDAFAFENELRQKFGTRPGSLTQEKLNQWISQSPERALLQSAIDLYEKETGTKLDVAKEGVPAVFARLRGHERKLRSEQRGVGRLGATTSLAAEAQSKIPPEPGEPAAPAAPTAPAARTERVAPETQKERDTDAAAIIRAEYDKEVARLKANPKDASAASNVDALARELKRQHKVTVLGASDILRGAKTEPATKTEETIRVRSKSDTSKTYTMPAAKAREAIASGKFERI